MEQKTLFETEGLQDAFDPFDPHRMATTSEARKSQKTESAQPTGPSYKQGLLFDDVEGVVEVQKTTAVDATSSVDASAEASAFNRSVSRAQTIANLLSTELGGLTSKIRKEPELLGVLIGAKAEATTSFSSTGQLADLLVLVDRLRWALRLPIRVQGVGNRQVKLTLQTPPHKGGPDDTDPKALKVAQAVLRGKKVPHKTWEGSVRQVAIVTYNRPDGLKRCLDGYVKNLERYGRTQVPITVWDDSSGANAEANRRIVDSYRRSGIAVKYIGPKEKQRMRKGLEQGLEAQTGRTADELGPVLDGLYGFEKDGKWKGSASKQRQWISTVFAGSRSLVVDDDTLPAFADAGTVEAKRAATVTANMIEKGVDAAFDAKEVVAPFKNPSSLEPIGYDIIGAAEEAPTDALISADFTFHRDQASDTVMRRFIRGGVEAFEALDGDLHPLGADAVHDKGKDPAFAGSTFITPNTINFAGVNLRSGRDQDFTMARMFSKLEGATATGRAGFLHYHERGPRWSNQASSLRQEYESLLVFDFIDEVSQAFHASRVDEPFDPEAFSQYALAELQKRDPLADPERMARTAKSFGMLYGAVREHGEKVDTAIDILQRRSAGETVRLTRDALSALVGSAEQKVPGVLAELSRFCHAARSLIEAPEGTPEPDIVFGLMRLAANLSEAEMPDFSTLKSMTGHELGRWALGVGEAAAGPLARAENLDLQDVQSAVTGAPLNDLALHQLATMTDEAPQKNYFLQVHIERWCAYFGDGADPEEVRGNPELLQHVRESAEQIIAQRTLHATGLDISDTSAMLETLTKTKDKNIALQSQMEDELDCGTEDASERIGARLQANARKDLENLLRSTPIAYAIQQNLYKLAFLTP